jgi:endonuclease III-like uncharacterized protein
MVKTAVRRAQARTRDLRGAYRLMRAHFGHQHWWPGGTAFEVCVGAILTQNTSWQDYHAQLVNVGKDYCRTRRPRCAECPLELLLPRNPACLHC